MLIDPETGAIKRIQGGRGGIDQDRERGRNDAINLGIRREDAPFGGLGMGLYGVSALCHIEEEKLIIDGMGKGFDDMALDMIEQQLGRRELRPRGREQSTPMLDSEDAFDTHSVAGLDEDGERLGNTLTFSRRH